MIIGLGDLTPEEEAKVRAAARATFASSGVMRNDGTIVQTKALAPSGKKGAKTVAKKGAKPSAKAKRPVKLTVAGGDGKVKTVVATPIESSTIFGVPQHIAIGVGVAAAAAIAWMMFGKGAATVTNPRRRRPARRLRSSNRRVQKAIDFREKFHWGIPTRAVVRRKVHKRPEVLTELGELASVTYRTKKRGESAQFFKHDFDSKRKPKLCMDVDNKRLHLLGGGYTVTADGITG